MAHYTKKALKEYYYDFFDNNDYETSCANELTQFLDPVFESLNLDIITELDYNPWIKHESIDELAKKYLEYVSFRCQLKEMRKSYRKYSNDYDKYEETLLRMGFKYEFIDSVLYNIDYIDYTSFTDWLCHCLKLWTGNNKSKNDLKINKKYFYRKADIKPLCYNLFACLNKCNIFVPKDIRKMLYDYIDMKNTNYWYHGTTLNNCDIILNKGVKPIKTELAYRLNFNNGFYLTNDFHYAFNWAKMKANNMCDYGVLVFDINKNSLDIQKVENMYNRYDYINYKLLEKDGVKTDSDICIFKNGMKKLNSMLIGIYI